MRLEDWVPLLSSRSRSLTPNSSCCLSFFANLCKSDLVVMGVWSDAFIAKAVLFYHVVDGNDFSIRSILIDVILDFL